MPHSSKSEFIPCMPYPGDSTAPHHVCEFEFVPSQRRPHKIYVVFDGRRIAQRSPQGTGEWLPLVTGYQVTDEGEGEIAVLFDGERLN